MSPDATGDHGSTPQAQFHVHVGPERIDPQTLYKQARTPETGAIVQFCGTVRNHNKDADVMSLEYEAYTEMAEAHILKIAARAHKDTPLWNASAVHRTGALSVGDVAVCVTVAASQRDAAFVACRRIPQPCWREISQKRVVDSTFE